MTIISNAWLGFADLISIRPSDQRDVAKLVKARDFDSLMRRFESYHPHQGE